jgi:hypothetical protein
MGLGIHEINPSVAQIGSNVDPGTQWEADIQSNVIDALNEAIATTPTALSYNQLIKSKLTYTAPITTAANTTTFACTQLIGFGNDFFKGWYAYVIWDAGGATAAPQGEYKLITDYVSTTGTFTIGAFTAAHAVTDIVMIMHPYLAQIQNLVTTIGTPLTAADITTADSLAMANLTGNSNARVATKTITGTHPTGWITDSTAMFNGAGAVEILAIVCKVTTAVENAATTLKIQAVVDALAAVDICAATTITNFAIKSVLAVTGTFADVMSGAGATAVGVLALNPSPIIISSTTSFTLNYLFSAASDGAIKFDILWIPLNAAGSITAA